MQSYVPNAQHRSIRIIWHKCETIWDKVRYKCQNAISVLAKNILILIYIPNSKLLTNLNLVRLRTNLKRKKKLKPFNAKIPTWFISLIRQTLNFPINFKCIPLVTNFSRPYKSITYKIKANEAVLSRLKRTKAKTEKKPNSKRNRKYSQHLKKKKVKKREENLLYTFVERRKRQLKIKEFVIATTLQEQNVKIV